MNKTNQINMNIFLVIIFLLQEAKCGALTQISESIWTPGPLDLQVPQLHCAAVTIFWAIQFRKSMAWLAMLNRQESGLDHLTASAQP